MKQKTIVFLVSVGIIVTALAIFLFQYFSPRPVVYDPGKANVQNIRHDNISTAITLNDNQKIAILELLSKYQCKRTTKSYRPFHAENAAYELILHTETETPWIILTGKVNICYVSSDRGAYEIVNPQNLVSELDKIIRPG